MPHNSNHNLDSKELSHSPSKGVVTEKVADEANYTAKAYVKSEQNQASSTMKSDYIKNSVE